MIGTYNYVLFTNDTTFLRLNWAKYARAMDYIYAKVDSTGLLRVTGTRDWARLQQGSNNSEANMMYVIASHARCIFMEPDTVQTLQHSADSIITGFMGWCRFRAVGGISTESINAEAGHQFVVLGRPVWRVHGQRHGHNSAPAGCELDGYIVQHYGQQPVAGCLAATNSELDPDWRRGAGASWQYIAIHIFIRNPGTLFHWRGDSWARVDPQVLGLVPKQPKWNPVYCH